MNYAHIVRELDRGLEGARDISLERAQQLYGAMLDGDMFGLELRTIALRLKNETYIEIIGFLAASSERLVASKRRGAGIIKN